MISNKAAASYLEEVLTTDYTISPALTSDIVEAYYISRSVIAEFLERGIIHPDVFENTFKSLSQAIENGNMLIMRKNDVCLGFVTYAESEPEELNQVSWLNSDLPRLYVSRLFVHPSWRSRGAGSVLVRYTEAYARERGYQALRMNVTSAFEDGNLLLMNNNYHFVGNIFLSAQKSPFNCYEKVL